MSRITRLMVIIVLSATTGACSITRTLDDGSQQHIGLMALTVPPSAAAHPAGEAFRVKSIGIHFYTDPDQSGLVLGYSDRLLMHLNDDSCVAEPQLSTLRSPDARSKRP